MRIAFIHGYEIEEVGAYDSKTGKVHFYLANGRDIWAPMSEVEWEEE